MASAPWNICSAEMGANKTLFLEQSVVSRKLQAVAEEEVRETAPARLPLPAATNRFPTRKLLRDTPTCRFPPFVRVHVRVCRVWCTCARACPLARSPASPPSTAFNKCIYTHACKHAQTRACIRARVCTHAHAHVHTCALMQACTRSSLQVLYQTVERLETRQL